MLWPCGTNQFEHPATHVRAVGYLMDFAVDLRLKSSGTVF